MSGYPDDRDRNDDRDRYGDDGRGRRDDRYDEPPGDGPRGDAEDLARGKRAVSGPAIGLIVVAGLTILASIGGMIQLRAVDAQFDDRIAEIERDPNIPAAQKKEQIDLINSFRETFKTAGPVYYGAGIVVALIVLIGAIKMLTLSSAGWGYAASILAMFPCSGCCILGLVFGIWGIVALGKPDAKAGFAAKRRGAYNPDRY